jgi:hypothetical protein
MRTFVIAALLVVVALGIYTQITIFAVPPIGAVPEGRTLIILRLNKTKFIDSADAMCDRAEAGVSILCRGVAIGSVVNNTKILLRLPYSEALYLISTGGKHYDR